MAATGVVEGQPERGMAPTEYRCPICQEASKSFRSLLHHVQWWHGFCRDAPATPQPRGEGEIIPNYNLVRKRDAYLREQGKLRAKVDKFFHRAEARVKLDRDAEEPRFRCTEGPPPAAVYEEFWPHAIIRASYDPGYTAVDSRDVSSWNKTGATDRATEATTCQSSEPFTTPDDAYSAAENAVNDVNQRVRVKAVTRAAQTNPRSTRRAEKHRVTFAFDDPATVQPKPPRRPPRYTRRVVRSCVNLSSFEIDRGRDIDESSAAVLVEAGLQRIRHLYLTHTVISPGAVIIMHGCCPRLKEINLVLHRQDFASTSAFGNFVAGFGALQQREPFDTFVRLGLTDDRKDLAEDIE
ncbi:hypothetical protein MTO96_013569 [Rhipicephalus appendiculatus]